MRVSDIHKFGFQLFWVCSFPPTEIQICFKQEIFLLLSMTEQNKSDSQKKETNPTTPLTDVQPAVQPITVNPNAIDSFELDALMRIYYCKIFDNCLLMRKICWVKKKTKSSTISFWCCFQVAQLWWWKGLLHQSRIFISETWPIPPFQLLYRQK